MANRDGAAAADNAVADSLDGSDFDWGLDETELSADTDGGIVTDESELSDNEIAPGGDETETQEEQGGQPAPGGSGKAPAAQQAKPPVAPAGSPQPQQQPITHQAPASEAPAQRQPAFHEVLNANFDQAVDHLVGQGTFRLAPKDAESFDDDTRQVLERQSAAIYLKSVATFSEILTTTLPGVVQSIIGVTDNGKAQEDRFYSEYGFDKSQHDTQLRQIMHNVKTLYPGATLQQVKDETARIGYAMLNVTPPAKPNGGAKPNGAGKPPAKREVSRTPFAPAGKAGGGSPQARRAPGTPAPQKTPMADLNDMLAHMGDLPD